MEGTRVKNREVLRRYILYEAAKLFLKQGYTNTTIKNITTATGIGAGSFNLQFPTKEDLMCALVKSVMNEQFDVAEQYLKGITDDKLLYYATVYTLQLYITESDEHIKDLYLSAYSMSKTSEIIQLMTTDRLRTIFKDLIPDETTANVYKMAVAMGGIIRGFMTVPCNIWFNMDYKVQGFLETSLRVFGVSDEQIEAAINFVSQIDFAELAQKTIKGYFDKLDEEWEKETK